MSTTKDRYTVLDMKTIILSKKEIDRRSKELTEALNSYLSSHPDAYKCFDELRKLP